MLIYLSFIDEPDDKRKFEEIYSSYKQTMFYAANRILKDNYTAEDAVHQAFIRIIDHLDKIEDVKSQRTRAFLVVIVEHIAIDIYRKRKKENWLSYDEMDIYIANDFEISFDNEIVGAIATLPLNYSTVLRLKYSQGYTDVEISRILDISEDNVRQRISRGKKKLAQLLNKERRE